MSGSIEVLDSHTCFCIQSVALSHGRQSPEDFTFLLDCTISENESETSKFIFVCLFALYYYENIFDLEDPLKGGSQGFPRPHFEKHCLKA